MIDAGATPGINNCGANDAPTPYNGTAVKCSEVCSWDAVGQELTCDLGQLGCNATPSVGELYAVKYVTANAQFSAYGGCQHTPADLDFCCKVTDPSGEIARVSLIGRDEQEEPIGFRWDGGGGNVKNFQPTHGGQVLAKAWGRGKSDTVVGSDSTASNYVEMLYGEDGDDDIYTNAGGGKAYGGNGLDVLQGGNGDDEFQGGNDNDTLRGGPGDDVLKGGYGTDEMFGDDDDDVMCDTRVPQPGGSCPGANRFEGGPGNDRAFSYLWTGCGYVQGGNVVGNGSVEEAKPLNLQWEGVGNPPINRVLTPAGTELADQTPYAECL